MLGSAGLPSKNQHNDGGNEEPTYDDVDQNVEDTHTMKGKLSKEFDGIKETSDDADGKNSKSNSESFSQSPQNRSFDQDKGLQETGPVGFNSVKESFQSKKENVYLDDVSQLIKKSEKRVKSVVDGGEIDTKEEIDKEMFLGEEKAPDCCRQRSNSNSSASSQRATRVNALLDSISTLKR